MHKFVHKNEKGSLNLELALIVSLLIIVAVGTLTYMAVGIDKQYNKGGESVADGGGGTPAVLDAPATLSFSGGQITWDAVDGATGYEVQESPDGGTTWNFVASTTDTNYTMEKKTLTPALADNFDWAIPAGSGVNTIASPTTSTINAANATALDHDTTHYFNNDQTSGASQGGSGWIDTTGMLHRSLFGNGAKTWWTDQAINDGAVVAIKGDAVGGSTIYLYARVTDENNFYKATVGTGTPKVILSKVVDGTPTTLFTSAGGLYTPAVGNAFKLDVKGNVLTFSVNGNVIATATDNTFASGYFGAVPGNANALVDAIIISKYTNDGYEYRVRATDDVNQSDWVTVTAN